jgi:hypothetical protein
MVGKVERNFLFRLQRPARISRRKKALKRFVTVGTIFLLAVLILGCSSVNLVKEDGDKATFVCNGTGCSNAAAAIGGKVIIVYPSRYDGGSVSRREMFRPPPLPLLPVYNYGYDDRR